MTDFDYKYLSIDEQIKNFYRILESADRDYRNEIDNSYMNIILTEIWMLNLTEEQSCYLEHLVQQIKQQDEKRSEDEDVYSAEELECLYNDLSFFRFELFKKHNICYPLFEH